MFRIIFLYFALHHLPGCPNGPWRSKHLDLNRHSPVWLSFLHLFRIGLWHFIHFLIWIPPSIKFGRLILSLPRGLHMKNHTYFYLQAHFRGWKHGLSMLWLEKEAGTSWIPVAIFQWEESSWYFRNEAFRYKFSRFQQLATPLFKKKTVFKSLLCYRLGTLIFQTLKCHLGSSLNIVSSACSSKACYNLEK